jgi:hypothetical protein
LKEEIVLERFPQSMSQSLSFSMSMSFSMPLAFPMSKLRAKSGIAPATPQSSVSQVSPSNPDFKFAPVMGVVTGGTVVAGAIALFFVAAMIRRARRSPN